ncbi:MAG: transglutaminase family protein [Acidobacteriota bacterium]
MKIQLGYDISFAIGQAVPIVAILSVHPSRRGDLQYADRVVVEPSVPTEDYLDTFGNICTRFYAPPGTLRLTNATVIDDSGLPDALNFSAREVPVEQLPPETLRFLMASRFCEVDLLTAEAAYLFGNSPRGWERVQAVCDWVNAHVTFSYPHARPTRTALDVYKERIGVCRDFQHLAITFCRALNIPARYATGYLGDIGVPLVPSPMDFSAWFEVYLDGRWWTFDARHNVPRIGRVLIATGLDATDVAITTSFGGATLLNFEVVTYELT